MSTIVRQEGKKQSTEIERKLRLRHDLMEFAAEGAVYVPYIGEADIASQLWADRMIYGCDLEQKFLDVARTRLSNADLRVANAERYPFTDISEAITIADFDAYGNPYLALQSFWQAIPDHPQRMVIFGTDGLRSHFRGNALLVLPEGTKKPTDLGTAREQYNYYWPRYIVPLLKRIVAPYTVIEQRHYFNKAIVYWGIVIDSNPGDYKPNRVHRNGKFGLVKQAAFLQLLSEGKRRGASASMVGVDPETIRQHTIREPEFLERMEKAEMQSNELIEDALFEAARAGNVVAIQVWLYNRSPDRWQDARQVNITVEYEKALRETRQSVELLLQAAAALPEAERERFYDHIENATKPIEGAVRESSATE